MESAIELRSRKGTSARKRSYYSELVSTNHAPDGACADQPLTRAPKLKIAPREVMSSWRAFRVNKPSSSGPMLRDNSPGNTSCGASADVAANEPWVTLGQEPSIVFARESFAPKVQMPVEAEPRHLVRNVETERRRRLYRSFELEVLFREAGIEPPSVVSAHHYLPLELFDDKEYDCRTPAEWLDLGLVRGKRYPTPAEALVPEEVTGEARWQPVAVTQHDAITNLYQLLTLDGTRRIFHLPRVFVRFYAEDPRVFVKRVVAALQMRIEAENGLRHSLELDCMPYDGIEALSDEQKSKIQLSAVRQDSPFKPDSISAVMREIERNYQRVMCDLECSSSIRCRRPDSWSQMGRTNVDPQSPGPPSPKKREPSRMKNFSGIRDYVKWKTLYVHVEVYEAMASIVNACDQAANVTLFPTERGKPVPIEEFNELQFCGTNAAISWLRKRWLEIMERSTRMHLRDMGKGHYDLDLGQHDVYEGTKLCRFFELTRLRMQTSLRTLIESSSLAYLVYLETPTLGVVDQKLDGSFSWPKDLKSERFFHEAPIFLLEIELGESSAFYTTDPRVFQEMLVSLYTQALMDCQKIGQVHPRLLENLKFPRNLWIESVDLEEPLPTEVRKRVREAYQASVVPLQAYVKMYDRYCPLFTLDPAKYAEDFVSSEHPPSELREEILSQQSLKRSLEAEIPESLVIGAFEVSVYKLKNLLTDKRQQMVDCLLGSHASRLRTLTEDILVGLRAVYTKLAVEPADIEQLQETREWMESLNVVVAEYMDGMQRLKPEYDLLDAFCWSLPDEDTQSKFEAARLPSLIQHRELETQETLAFLQKDTFYKLQLEDESATAEKIDGLIGSVSNVMMQKDVGKVQEIAVEVKKLWASMKETEDFGFVLNSRQKLFGVPVRPFRNLTKLIKNFEPYKSFWITSAEWFKWYDVWMYEPLMGIENGQIEAIVNEWHKTISRCVKLFQDIQDLSALANDVKEQIDNFKPYVGVIQALRNPGMKTRHLEQISNKVGMNASEMSELTFADLLSLDIMRFEEDIKDISEGAAKEYAIEETLNKMIADWATLKVEVAPYKETGMYIVRVSDELQILLDDHILNTQQLSFSQFKGALEGEIDDWYSKLCLTREVIVEWLEVQKLWMYLEPIFSSEDISRQLPTEAKKYNSMERNWRRITKQALDNPTIMQLCPDRTLLESLRECMSLLETVQKGLSDFLESRRLIFPRFFFLSDDELLSMLAEAKSPRAVQPHLKKCFENIKEVRFAETEAARITHMCSAEGEEVALEPSPLEPRAAVEYWLGELEDAMRETLRCCAERALHSVEKLPRRRWIFRWPGQVALCIGQASWTSHVERAIATSSLPNYFRVSISQLDELRELVRQPRTDVERLMLEAIITIEVHARDVLQRLIDDAVRDVNDFNWISQLRYYWVISPEQSIGDLKIRAVNAEFPYGYEYLGNNGRLVITPLTDRCYLTLTGALHLKFGGAPAGPAGTGKTETTKDLAKALAIQCVVFNCSDQLDYMSMGKFFKGLASSGAWACFDEFNRIDVEVLSVIAQQVMTIQKAQQLNAERFIFEGVELRLRMSCAVFITMNPGYAGRTELPDNLKALFRPVAMMVPLVHLIAEISLFSCGFGQAKALATKITATFKLSSEQLSSQDHYDFGMRSVKTVIAVAGNLKREQKDMGEQQICLKALRDVNVPKFLRDDLILFNGIISDLFPQVEEKQMDYATLVEGIRKSIRKRGLAEVPTFIQKVIQLYETTIVRHGLMLVGATGSGKTKCYQVLQGAFELLKGRDQPSGKPFTPAIVHTVNPKSITMGQLYGEFDLNTHEWWSTIFGTILSSWLARGASLGEFVKPIMTTSLRIFSTLCKELLPTPDKCHYTFNVRDLGKVFQGMLMAEPSQIHVLDDLLLLWYHENCRVFRDRLVNVADRQWFDRLVRKTMMEVLDYDVRQSLLDDALFYGNFCNPDNQYERIRNAKNMENTMLELLEDYNSSTTVPINLVLFEDAMSHVCRITRILNQSPGNALLLGMGGSGRQSLTKLSSHIAEYSCFQIELTKAYSMRDWRDDVKSLLLKTGVHDRSSVFLFSDVQIKYDAFLEDINNILSSGDVPNIYQSDEINQIFQATRNIVQESGLPVNRSNLLAAYRKIVRNNLHAVITMCPIGELFRSRIRQFPALVNMCTIDWFDPWPDSALRSVAFHFLSNTGDEAITGNVLKSIVDTCQFMHSSVIRASEDFLQELNRHNYVTPTSYLELLSSYGDLLDKKKRELHAGINRLSVGLEKLASTEIEVKEMQITLEKMQPELVRAAKMSAKMIEEIGRDTTIAEEARAQAAEQEKEALKLKKANQIIRDDAEADLNTVRPMLLEAENSLKALNKGDITEVKAMKRPPPGVVLVIEAMCIVKGVKPLKIAGERPGEKLNDYWTPGSLMLADAGQFLTSLANYDKEAITEDIILKLKPYVANPGFHPKKIMKVSKACHSLCMWLHAMYNYYFVNERVKPKMAALEQAQSVLVSTEAALAEAMAKLEAVQAGLDKLQQKFQREEERKRELEAQKQLCQDRMSRAVRLVSGLADESKRWLASVAKDKVTLGKLVGDVLLCAGAIAYLTPFVDSYRKRLLTSWQQMLLAGVPHTPGREPVTLLGDPVEIRMWHLDGLPRDALSVENAVLVANSRRWPLLVDPQGQAHRWLRNLGGRSAGGLSTVRMSDRDLLRVVESCVRFGRTCLIENVGLELEPALDTVLMRSLFRQAGQLSVKIGDNVVPYNEDFRLYLVTKLPNPHYAPEVAVKVLIVNFSLTASGLSDQMLSLVIMHERPDLEETRSSLLVASAQMKQELQQIEDRILLRLSLSEGSAVDDIDLIDTLEASKIKSEEIKLKVVSAETAQESIDAARSLYVPVAERAQVLFFCLLDLQLIDTMYQYSLEWFIRIFTNSMLNTEKDDDVGKRVQGVNDFFTFALYCNVCQSLFERHKLHFAFLLCVRIQMMGDLIDRNEWKFLLSGAISPRKEPNPAPEWLPERCWAEILSLQVLPKFQSFVPSFKNLVGKFQLVFEAQQPEKTNLPEPWNGKLDDLEKLIVLKCLRPDKVVNAVQIYVSVHLGAPFVEPQASGLDAMFKETSPTTPFIFVLSSGTDPASELYKFAEKHKMARKLYSISLGQGQGPRAELMLKQSIDVGNWIFFQNCHLAPSWMPTLEILVEKLPPNDIHRDFRLWLTSMPSTAFPVSILQNGCKLTMEPPRGVKANMMRTYSTKVVEMQEFFESEHPKVANFKSLVYSLSLFHAVLLERRKYGPLGFNIPYEFTDGDFVICMSQLHMFLLEYVIVPFKVLTYTAGHINYGGRITDDWDRRCVLTILSMFYNDRVLVPGHQFDPEGLYFQPPGETSLAEYVALIKQFPINDDPGLFGLHANANISYAQAETYACLTSLETLQPRDIAVAGATEGADEGLTRLARRILDGLPELFHLPDIQRKYPVMYEESLNMVLAQEATRYNALLKIMSSSLKDLLLAIKGVVVMSETLETMALALNSNKVPENWQRRAFASLKPLGAWVEDLKRRTEFIRRWQEAGIPAAFWISGFYFPQALLTGTLQNYARKYGLAIDTIDFAFQVLPAKPDRAPENGCVVYGLFLEGCRWDGSYLAESLPRELFTDMAPVLFLPEIDHKVAASGIYECPVYKTVKRAGTLSTTGHSTNFILPMEIPSREPQAHWITRGVALICSLDF
ncbi:dynein heavy chain 1, axonemal-like [Copidosoma floridanum]|uniref:dynein heavy chain 1, axonemal-like n=1 Tax=Copidosoma floridanum TaxID=29053 RepID=UPI000C6F5162|nr:dynein heavy chain 1, axonemal-like [Copidosoma floridanum]